MSGHMRPLDKCQRFYLWHFHLKITKPNLLTNHKNTSLAELRPLTHHLQSGTAYKIQNYVGILERGVTLAFWAFQLTVAK